MTASKFTEAQKAFIIKQGEEGATFAEICLKAGNSSVLAEPRFQPAPCLLGASFVRGRKRHYSDQALLNNLC